MYDMILTGTLVTIVSATDDDAGENAAITYSISYTDDKPLPFNIDPFTGEVNIPQSYCHI